jgi:hypothetical protein
VSHASGVANRAHPRHNGATDERRLPEPESIGQSHKTLFRNHGVLTEAPYGEKLLQLTAGISCMRLAPSVSTLAKDARRPGSQRFSCPSRHGVHVPNEAERNTITYGPVHYPIPDRLDDAGTLVPQDEREVVLTEVTVNHVQIGMTDTGRGHLHPHLAGSWCFYPDAFDLTTRARLT